MHAWRTQHSLVLSYSHCRFFIDVVRPSVRMSKHKNKREGGRRIKSTPSRVPPRAWVAVSGVREFAGDQRAPEVTQVVCWWLAAGGASSLSASSRVKVVEPFIPKS